MFKKRREKWAELFRATSAALVEVVRAELAVLADQWTHSGRWLAAAAALFAVTLTFLSVATVLVLFGAVALLHELAGWSWWAAAGSLALALLVLAGALAAGGYYILVKRLENPFITARVRFDDHVAWWRLEVLGEAAAEAVEAAEPVVAVALQEGEDDAGSGAAPREQPPLA